MTSKGHRYDQEFKLQVVRMVEEHHHKVTDVAADLGMSRKTIYRWLKEYGAFGGEGSPGGRRPVSRDEEMRALRRRIADLEEENAILKKAAAIFARPAKQPLDS